MKRVLIISPYFAPANAADMHRVRMSLPFFKDFSWEAEIVTVDERYADITKDSLLLGSLAHCKIHKVKAFSKKWTGKIGLGSIALRSLYFYKKEVNKLLKKKTFDLVYFSTTQFPVIALGPYWKRKFDIPFVVDLQDPWHTDYYKNKPKPERPKKYWFSYRLNKYLEPIALKNADGIISVSQSYIDTVRERYPSLRDKPAAVITFGVFKRDFEIAQEQQFPARIEKTADNIDLLYVGRGGHDLKPALTLLFNTFKAGLEAAPVIFKKIRFRFFGTSYAPAGQGEPTIRPLAKSLGIDNYVTEQTDRISFYETLSLLQDSDGLIIPGSEDGAYNASKLLPYIFSKRPLLGIFHSESSPFKILRESNAGDLIPINGDVQEAMAVFINFIAKIEANAKPETNWPYLEEFTAENLTKAQTAIFDAVCSQYKKHEAK